MKIRQQQKLAFNLILLNFLHFNKTDCGSTETEFFSKNFTGPDKSEDDTNINSFRIVKVIQIISTITTVTNYFFNMPFHSNATS